jgi:hypothetical protein
VIFDFRYRNAEGKWKAFGHRKGLNRDTAFASLEALAGRSSATEYMSRPRDGRTRNWDLFRRNESNLDSRSPDQPSARLAISDTSKEASDLLLAGQDHPISE